MTRACRLLLAATIACGATACDRAPGAAGGDGREVRLAIENAGGDRLRCVAVLAHFVTLALPAIPAGGRLELALRRGDDGSLAYGSSGGRAMLVENVLCGTDSRWTAVDLPLLAVRTGNSRRFRCAGTGEALACAP